MQNYKRINQLDQAFIANDNDYFAIDQDSSLETKKIKKSDLFNNYLKDAPNNVDTKDWIWARKNGNWYRIYPDDYIVEAPIDGKIYVRVNGKWVTVEGVNGDMLRSIYDPNNKSTDIFKYIDDSIGIKDNATESLLGLPIVKTGESIEKDFTINSNLLNFIIKGNTVEFLEDDYLPKSFDNKASLVGLNNFTLYTSGKNPLRDKEKIIFGSYTDPSLSNIIHTDAPVKVNPEETYTIGETLTGIEYKFLSVTKDNKVDNIFSTSYLTKNDSFKIPSNVNFLGIEIRYNLSEETFISENFEKPFSQYLQKTIIYCNNQFNKITFNSNSQLHYINENVYDYIDLVNKKEIHNIAERDLTYTDNWEISDIGIKLKTNTIPFKLNIGENIWTNDSLFYGNSNCLKNSLIDDFANLDSESICFYNGNIYIRISYERLNIESNLSDEEYLIALKSFLLNNPIKIIFENGNPIVEEISNQFELKVFDSITNFLCLSILNFNDKDYEYATLLEAKFDNVVNNLIRKSGDKLLGQLIVYGENNLVISSIVGSDGNGAIGGPIFFNKDNQEKIYVNGNNPILDKRDFDTNLNWEPKVKTIAEKEANDQRIVNAEYIHRDYAPLDSPNLIGIPTAPKANSTGTSQIANGEFIEENYYNKDLAKETFITKVDGVAKGNLILDETLPQENSNKKLIPNIEFIENYYYDKSQTNEKFALLDSPNFIGTPTAPTPDELNNSQIANVDYVLRKSTQLQSQIDMIPKYKYLEGVSFSIEYDSWPEQSVLNSLVNEKLSTIYPNPVLWNALTVTITLLPGDQKRDLFYYYSDGTVEGIEPKWYYLYDLSTTINRANGTVAGIIESSSNGDISITNGDPVVNHSTKATMDGKGNQIDLTYATIAKVNELIDDLKSQIGRTTVYLVKWEE